MEQDKKEQPPQQAGRDRIENENSEQSRKPESAQQASAEKSTDISAIDQQEGQMNNGELGGNFNESGSESA